MADAKIGFTIGTISFSAEGEEAWVTKKLDEILAKIPELLEIAPEVTSQADLDPDPSTGDAKIAKKTLASFLKEKSATTVQVKKFLATSVWLHAKGNKRLKTAQVTKALKDSNQTRIGNPADILNKNLTKGHCEKDGTQFFVTDDGKDSL